MTPSFSKLLPSEQVKLLNKLLLSVPKVKDIKACAFWTGYSNGRYGMVRTGRHNFFAHRLSYELYYGPIAPGNVVMHSCDNPLCINPLHLSQGTQKENLADMKAKGRIHDHRGKGNAKLSFAEVRLLRALKRRKYTNKNLGLLFGICEAAASEIGNGNRYANVR